MHFHKTLAVATELPVDLHIWNLIQPPPISMTVTHNGSTVGLVETY